jgi:hypothetical protein
MANEANLELETFRKQWQDEVSARAKASPSSQNPATPSQAPKNGSEKKDFHPRLNTSHQSWRNYEERVDGLESASYHDLENKNLKTRLGESNEGIQSKRDAAREPSSALEHYEHAVERESQGNLGDSLKLYRKAYRVRAFQVSDIVMRADLQRLAGRRSGSSLQGQALSTVNFQIEPHRPQPVKCLCDSTEHCPPLPRWTPPAKYLRPHIFILLPLHPACSTANR